VPKYHVRLTNKVNDYARRNMLEDCGKGRKKGKWLSLV
jgi:hypothetical protein